MTTQTTTPQPTCERGSGRFTHLVTLINRRTDEEACIVVVTSTDRFHEVLQAVRVQRVLHGLTGYEIHESVPCDDLF